MSHMCEYFKTNDGNPNKTAAPSNKRKPSDASGGGISSQKKRIIKVNRLK